MASPSTTVSEPAALADKVYRSELNPVDFLARAAYIYPEKLAIVDGERRLTCREFGERSWRLANALHATGVQKGDRVATLLLNSSAMLEVCTSFVLDRLKRATRLDAEKLRGDSAPPSPLGTT